MPSKAALLEALGGPGGSPARQFVLTTAVLTSAHERSYGVCDPCAGIRSNGTIKARLQWQRQQGRGAETDSLSLLQRDRIKSAHFNETFEPFAELKASIRTCSSRRRG